jgi:hypothetical protein
LSISDAEIANLCFLQKLHFSEVIKKISLRRSATFVERK